MDELPAQLRGPVAFALARAEETIPGVGSMPGAAWYEPKWDGFRGAVVVSQACPRLRSRQGQEMTDRFPDIVAAAGVQVAAGTVLDGELVIWNGTRLDFDLLQRRLVNSGKKAAGLAAQHPASFMVFDLLALRGEDLRRRTLAQRREVLEALAQGWSPPLQLSPGRYVGRLTVRASPGRVVGVSRGVVLRRGPLVLLRLRVLTHQPHYGGIPPVRLRDSVVRGSRCRHREGAQDRCLRRVRSRVTGAARRAYTTELTID